MKINKIEKGLDISAITALLSQGERNSVSYVNWDAFPYKPHVDFAILHDGDNIYLNYKVDEQASLALTMEDNGPVWTDSCVEFFISFNGTNYYNLEVNCIGTALLAYRKTRSDSVSATQEQLSQIKRYPTLKREPFYEKNVGDWGMTLVIPKEAFFCSSIDTLCGFKASANFYKCGDNLSVPHFISWNPINNPTPNFHLPQFFGEIEFEE